MSFVRVNGVRLYYEDHGAGPPILCIHGTSGSAKTWSGAVGPLTELGRVILYDRRGCTRSERPEPYETTSVHDHAEDAAALLRALGAAPAVVIGRSYGGEVALDLGMRHPELVRAMALLEPVVWGLDSEADDWADHLTADVLNVAATRGVEAVGEAFMEMVLGEGSWEALPTEWQQVISENGQAILAEVRGGDLQTDAAALAALDRPALVVSAQDSPKAFQRVAELVAGAIPDCRLAVVEGGHLISPTDPVVLAFVQELDGA